ncbi:MAG: glycosyl hydrolase [Collinsella aerofaciens]
MRFDAPTGITTIELYVTSQKTGFRDEYINMVDAASCRVLIDAVYEPTFEHLGDEFGKTILGFFTDEPGFMNEKGTAPDDASTSSYIGRSDLALPWSDELARRLYDALGENWLAKLHGLWTREANGAQVRHAYMDLATQLYRSCFDEQIGDWCRAHGVMHIGHVIEDKSCHTRLGQGAGHYFRAVAGQDMAGVDVVINQLAPGIDRGRYSYFHGAWNMEFFTYALAKLGSSAAPKKQGRCMAEVFGAFGWHEGLREMKWIADHMLVRGINWFTPHAFSMAPFPDWDCPPHFYAHGNNPQWPHFGQLMRYMNRTATLLSEGAAARPVAILYHADAEWAGNAMPVERVAAELTRAQIDFDFVPAEAFEDEGRYEVSIADGMLAVNGCRYQAFVMPGASFIGAATAEEVRRMMAAGVTVLAADEVPGALYDADGAADLDGLTATPLADVADALADAGLQTVVTDRPQPWLRALRYKRAGETYVMLVNEHPRESICCTVALARGERLCGTRLDLLNGTEPVAFDGALELAPFESCVVVLEASGAIEPADCTDTSTCNARPRHQPLLDRRPLPCRQRWNLWRAAKARAPVRPHGRAVPRRMCTFRYRTSFELVDDLAHRH